MYCAHLPTLPSFGPPLNRPVGRRSGAERDSSDSVSRNPEKAQAAMRALLRAEAFVKRDQDKARSIIGTYSNMVVPVTQDFLASTRHRLELDQSLLLALEDEARWAMKWRVSVIK